MSGRQVRHTMAAITLSEIEYSGCKIFRLENVVLRGIWVAGENERSDKMQLERRTDDVARIRNLDLERLNVGVMKL